MKLCSSRYVLGVWNDRLTEMVLLSTHNIYLGWYIWKLILKQTLEAFSCMPTNSSKILHTSCLSKRPRQTVLTQIRISLIGSSLFAILTCILCIAALIYDILFENRRKKSVWNFRTLINLELWFISRLAPVLKTIFHQCVISYTCS